MSKGKFERRTFEGNVIPIYARQGPGGASNGPQSPPATDSNPPPSSTPPPSTPPPSTPPPNGGGGGGNTPPPSSSSSPAPASTSTTSTASSPPSTPTPPPSSPSAGSTSSSSNSSSSASSSSSAATPPPASASASNSSTQLVSTSVIVTVVTTDAQGTPETITSTSSGLVPLRTNRTSNAAANNAPTATIVGASVGGVVGLILLALVIAFCVRRKRHNSWKGEFDGNFDPDRTTTLPGIYTTGRFRDDPDPPPSRPSRDELRQASFGQPVSSTGGLGTIRVEPFVPSERGAVSPPMPPAGTGAVGPYPQQQSYFDPRGPFVQQQPPSHLQAQGYYPPQQQQYRPAHNTSLSASTLTHYTGSSDAGSGTHLLDSTGVPVGLAARPAKEREAFGAARTSSTTSGASYPSTSASGKQAQAHAGYPSVSPYAITNPSVNPPPSPPLPTGSPAPTTRLGAAGPLRVTNPSRQDSGHSVAGAGTIMNNNAVAGVRTNDGPYSPTANDSRGVLVHRDGGRVPDSGSVRLEEIPPTYDSIGK